MISLLRRSLQVRTVAATVLLSTIALFALGGFLSFTLSDGLYQSRVNQVLEETERSVGTVQNTISAAALVDETSLQVLLNSVVPSLEISGATRSRQVALLRSPGQAELQLLQSPISANLDLRTIPDALRSQVRSAGDSISYTPVAIQKGDVVVPGITVGVPINIPLAGAYELYLVYDLAAEQETLNFVQSVLLVGGLVLVGAIALVSSVVTRRIVSPMERAAAAAERLAEGNLNERLAERGEDVIAVLARSFNRMANSLQQQIQRLDSLSQMQRRFVSDVSHELRTPLTTIKLAGESIFAQRDSLDPNLARSAELMQSQIERFEGLLSDLLEISRYDAGAVVPELELTDVKSVVRSAVASLEPLAASQKVKIEVKAPREPIEAELDFRRIERLLRNLISNALEHSESEPVRVQIGANTEAVAISVTDRGPGMSGEQLNHVFDRFWRADPARKRSTGGTGLGLSIAKEDATVHRGWLQVWSEPGRGSSFRLTLPRRRDYNVIDSPLKLPPPELAKAKKNSVRSKT